MLSESGAPGQPVPVVADHVPAADDERRDHEHDRDSQPDLGQLERRASSAPDRPRLPASRSGRSRHDQVQVGHRGLPDRRDPDFELEAGTGLLSMLTIRL